MTPPDPTLALLYRPAVARAVARALHGATPIPRALRALVVFERGARVPDDVRATPAGVGDASVAVVPLERAVQLAQEREAPETVHVEAPPVILDGRRVDDGLQRRRTSETLRAGGSVPSR